VRNWEVRFALNNGHRQPDLSGPKSATSGLMQRSIIRSDRGRGQQFWSDGEVGLTLPLTAEKSTSVILVLNQYKRIECSPGKLPDTRTMATGSGDDSRDSVHDRCLCIAVWRSERVPR
jgi:hypothetical protein